MFNVVVRFTLILLFVVADACNRGYSLVGCLSELGQYPSTGPPTYQIIKVPNTNLMNVMKTSLTIIPNVSSGAPLLLLEFVQAYPLLHKGLGHLAALYLLYLLFARYYLSYHETIYHLQFQCLQRKPY